MSKILTSKQRIVAFSQLSHVLQKPDEELKQLISSAQQYNAWFTPQSTAKAVAAIAKMLSENDLQKWLEEKQDLSQKSF
jgi:hypothetical protein